MRILLALTAALAVSACAARPVPLALAPAPAPIPALAFMPAVPVGLSAINRDLSGAGTVWHLRAALNVAALACRGPQAAAIVARYNALLTAHKAPLATAQTAFAAEFAAAGPRAAQARYDHAMTRLYNFFSQSPARDRFCTAAAGVLADTVTLTPDALSRFAARRLPDLDAPFAAPAPASVIAVSAPVPQAPAGPWLTVNVAALN